MGQAQSEAEGVSLTKVLRVDPSQQALLYNLSRDVAAGRPGSVIIISGHAQALKTLLYLKVGNFLSRSISIFISRIEPFMFR